MRRTAIKGRVKAALLLPLLTFAASGAASAQMPAPQQPHFKPHALVRATRPEDVGFDSERLKRLENYVQDFVDNSKLAGLTTLVARHGKIVQAKTYGRKTVDGPPMTMDTIFRIYSMSKPVTGVALMMLFEEGKFRLDDPVTRFLPEFKNLKVLTGTDAQGNATFEDAKKPPTIRQLMSHTAGYGYGLSNDSQADKIYRANAALTSANMDEFIRRAAKLPLVYQAGTSFEYSIAADIQGALVERISGQKFGDFLRDRIFRPLKMNDTGFNVSTEKLGRLAGLYNGMKDGRLQDAPTVFGWPRPDPSQPVGFESGGAGLYSTTMDYARFCQMLLNGGELDGVRILAPATVALMATNHEPKDALDKGAGGFNATRSFGLDFEVLNDPAAAGSIAGKGTFSWGGAAGTWFWIDPTNDVIAVGMVQRFDYWEPDHPNNMGRLLVYQALTHPEL
ncbi:MAG: serine hydrolase domain-containing protein [Sphingomicrobium sp.]